MMSLTFDDFVVVFIDEITEEDLVEIWPTSGEKHEKISSCLAKQLRI